MVSNSFFASPLLNIAPLSLYTAVFFTGARLFLIAASYTAVVGESTTQSSARLSSQGCTFASSLSKGKTNHKKIKQDKKRELPSRLNAE
jgi:hypothetical protein